jgi:hypothetical protein
MFDNLVEFEGAVRQIAVAAHGRAEPSQKIEYECGKEYGKARNRIKNQSHNGKDMNGNEINENARFAFGGLPDGHFPGA